MKQCMFSAMHWSIILNMLAVPENSINDLDYASFLNFWEDCLLSPTVGEANSSHLKCYSTLFFHTKSPQYMDLLWKNCSENDNYEVPYGVKV